MSFVSLAEMSVPENVVQSPLSRPLKELRGVGTEREAQLARLGLVTVRDLLRHRPRRYEDRRYFRNIAELELDEASTTRGTIVALGLKRFKKGMRPEQKAIAKYIFPGGELDDIGHSIFAMERAGFEIQDVEAWRMHYARTCKLWCERLTANREEALKHVSEEKYRIWVAYLAGVSLAFSRGTLRIFQTLVSKNAKRPPAIPPTRADLYR